MTKAASVALSQFVKILRPVPDERRAEILRGLCDSYCSRCGKARPCKCKKRGRPRKSPKTERATI